MQQQQQRGTDGFHLNAAVDFLQHSQHRSTSIPPTNTAPGAGLNDVIGGLGSSGQKPPVGLPPARGVSAPEPLISAQGRDDAQIIDSLFGPTQGHAGNNGSSLLSGLQELSLGGEGANSTGLWGATNTPNDGGGLKGLPPIGGPAAGSATQPMGNSLLFANNGPALDPKTPQSRFAWGESSNG